MARLRVRKKINRIIKKGLRFLAYNGLFFIIGICVFQGYKKIISSPFFALKEVSLKGDSFLKGEDLSVYFKDMVDKNIFTVDANSIAGCLRRNAAIEKIEVEKFYPDKLVVNIKEREPMVLLALNKNYFMDRQGMIMEEIKAGSPVFYSYPLLKGIREDELFDNEGINKKAVSDEKKSAFVFQFVPGAVYLKGLYERGKNYWQGMEGENNLNCSTTESSIHNVGLLGRAVASKKGDLGLKIIEYLQTVKYPLKSTQVEYLELKSVDEITLKLRQLNPRLIVSRNFIEDLSSLSMFFPLLNREEKNIEYIDLRFKSKVIFKKTGQLGEGVIHNG